MRLSHKLGRLNIVHIHRSQTTETVQRLLGFNRDRTETMDRDRGKTYAKNRDRGLSEKGVYLENLLLRVPRSLLFRLGFATVSVHGLCTVSVKTQQSLYGL